MYAAYAAGSVHSELFQSQSFAFSLSSAIAGSKVFFINGVTELIMGAKPARISSFLRKLSKIPLKKPMLISPT